MAGPNPTVVDVTPSEGGAKGGDLVTLELRDLEPEGLFVEFGGARATVVSAESGPDSILVKALTPPSSPGEATVRAGELDADGAVIPSSVATWSGAFTYRREDILEESNLTRLTRALLRLIKDQVLEDTSISVSVDYDDTAADGLSVISMAALPSIVLSGPRITPNRPYSEHVLVEEMGEDDQTVLYRQPAAVDLVFDLSCASERTVELLNLMTALARVGEANTTLALPKDPSAPEAGTVTYELELAKDFKTSLRGKGDVRVFTSSLYVRGFHLASPVPVSVSRPVEDIEISITNGGTP